MKPGTVGILNVGAGDTKISFDPKNPIERVRAARIVTDMLRRGYALMVAVERRGKTTYQRVLKFREDKCEYVIADLDPEAAQPPEEPRVEPVPQAAPVRKGRGARSVPAEKAHAVAVAPSAGG